MVEEVTERLNLETTLLLPPQRGGSLLSLRAKPSISEAERS